MYWIWAVAPKRDDNDGQNANDYCSTPHAPLKSTSVKRTTSTKKQQQPRYKGMSAEEAIREMQLLMRGRKPIKNVYKNPRFIKAFPLVFGHA